VDFVRDNLGEPVPDGTFRHLLDFLEQNEDNTDIHNDMTFKVIWGQGYGQPIKKIPTVSDTRPKYL